MYQDTLAYLYILVRRKNMIIFIIKFRCIMFLLFVSYQAIDKICDSIALLYYKKLIRLKTEDLMYVLHICSMIGSEPFGVWFISTSDISLQNIEVEIIPIIVWVFAMSFLFFFVPCFCYNLINATDTILDKDDKYARKICTTIICIALILIPFSIPLLSYGMF